MLIIIDNTYNRVQNESHIFKKLMFHFFMAVLPVMLQITLAM